LASSTNLEFSEAEHRSGCHLCPKQKHSFFLLSLENITTLLEAPIHTKPVPEKKEKESPVQATIS